MGTKHKVVVLDHISNNEVICRCNICNSSFSVTYSRVIQNRAKYCSMTCSHKGKIKQKPVTLKDKQIRFYREDDWNKQSFSKINIKDIELKLHENQGIRNTGYYTIEKGTLNKEELLNRISKVIQLDKENLSKEEAIDKYISFS